MNCALKKIFFITALFACSFAFTPSAQAHDCVGGGSPPVISSSDWLEYLIPHAHAIGCDGHPSGTNNSAHRIGCDGHIYHLDQDLPQCPFVGPPLPPALPYEIPDPADSTLPGYDEFGNFIGTPQNNQAAINAARERRRLARERLLAAQREAARLAAIAAARMAAAEAAAILEVTTAENFDEAKEDAADAIRAAAESHVLGRNNSDGYPCQRALPTAAHHPGEWVWEDNPQIRNTNCDTRYDNYANPRLSALESGTLPTVQELAAAAAAAKAAADAAAAAAEAESTAADDEADAAAEALADLADEDADLTTTAELVGTQTAPTAEPIRSPDSTAFVLRSNTGARGESVDVGDARFIIQGLSSDTVGNGGTCTLAPLSPIAIELMDPNGDGFVEYVNDGIKTYKPVSELWCVQQDTDADGHGAGTVLFPTYNPPGYVASDCDWDDVVETDMGTGRNVQCERMHIPTRAPSLLKFSLTGTGLAVGLATGVLGGYHIAFEGPTSTLDSNPAKRLSDFIGQYDAQSLGTLWGWVGAWNLKRPLCTPFQSNSDLFDLPRCIRLTKAAPGTTGAAANPPVCAYISYINSSRRVTRAYGVSEFDITDEPVCVIHKGIMDQGYYSQWNALSASQKAEYDFPQLGSEYVGLEGMVTGLVCGDDDSEVNRNLMVYLDRDNDGSPNSCDDRSSTSEPKDGNCHPVRGQVSGADLTVGYDCGSEEYDQSASTNDRPITGRIDVEIDPTIYAALPETGRNFDPSRTFSCEEEGNAENSAGETVTAYDCNDDGVADYVPVSEDHRETDSSGVVDPPFEMLDGGTPSDFDLYNRDSPVDTTITPAPFLTPTDALTPTAARDPLAAQQSRYDGIAFDPLCKLILQGGFWDCNNDGQPDYFSNGKSTPNGVCSANDMRDTCDGAASTVPVTISIDYPDRCDSWTPLGEDTFAMAIGAVTRRNFCAAGLSYFNASVGCHLNMVSTDSGFNVCAAGLRSATGFGGDIFGQYRGHCIPPTGCGFESICDSDPSMCQNLAGIMTSSQEISAQGAEISTATGRAAVATEAILVRQAAIEAVLTSANAALDEIRNDSGDSASSTAAAAASLETAVTRLIAIAEDSDTTASETAAIGNLIAELQEAAMNAASAREAAATARTQEMTVLVSLRGFVQENQDELVTMRQQISSQTLQGAEIKANIEDLENVSNRLTTYFRTGSFDLTTGLTGSQQQGGAGIDTAPFDRLEDRLYTVIDSVDAVMDSVDAGNVSVTDSNTLLSGILGELEDGDLGAGSSNLSDANSQDLATTATQTTNVNAQLAATNIALSVALTELQGLDANTDDVETELETITDRLTAANVYNSEMRSDLDGIKNNTNRLFQIQTAIQYLVGHNDQVEDRLTSIIDNTANMDTLLETIRDYAGQIETAINDLDVDVDTSAMESELETIRENADAVETELGEIKRNTDQASSALGEVVTSQDETTAAVESATTAQQVGNAKLSTISGKLSALTANTRDLDINTDLIEPHLAALRSHVDGLEIGVSNVQTAIEGHRDNLTAIAGNTGKIDDVASATDAAAATLTAIKGVIDEVEGAVENLETINSTASGKLTQLIAKTIAAGDKTEDAVDDVKDVLEDALTQDALAAVTASADSNAVKTAIAAAGAAAEGDASTAAGLLGDLIVKQGVANGWLEDIAGNTEGGEGTGTSTVTVEVDDSWDVSDVEQQLADNQSEQGLLNQLVENTDGMCDEDATEIEGSDCVSSDNEGKLGDTEDYIAGMIGEGCVDADDADGECGFTGDGDELTDRILGGVRDRMGIDTAVGLSEQSANISGTSQCAALSSNSLAHLFTYKAASVSSADADDMSVIDRFTRAAWLGSLDALVETRDSDMVEWIIDFVCPAVTYTDIYFDITFIPSALASGMDAEDKRITIYKESEVATAGTKSWYLARVGDLIFAFIFIGGIIAAARWTFS